MKAPVKFLRLSPADRRLLSQALLLLWACRLGLWLLPFKKLRQILEEAKPPPRHDGHPVDSIAWSVEVASRYTPSPTCLVRAMAARMLLEKNGHPSALRIGVRGGENFEAHAWVESGGKVVTGDIGLDGFRPIASFGGGGSET